MKNGVLKIEKGIPIPTGSGRKGQGKVQIAMKAMKKGDSVLLAHSKAGNTYSQAKAYLGAGNYAVRPEGDGFRVWRIK